MPSSRTVSRRRPTLLPRPLPAERSQCTPARNTWRRPWRRCGVWGAVSPPGSRASPLPLQNIYRGPAASLRCRIPAFPPICKPSLWRWPPRQRATPPLPKRSFPGAGPCGGTAPLGCGYHGGRQSCSHPGGAPYRVSPHLHRSARRSRCGTSSISGKGRKQRYSYLPHRTRLCRFCFNPAPSGRGYLPDGSLNQRKENQSP